MVGLPYWWPPSALSLSQVGWPERIGVLRTSKHICSFPKYPTARLRLIEDAKVTEIRMFREAFVRRSSSWLNTRRPFLPVQRASHGPSSSHVLIAISGAACGSFFSASYLSCLDRRRISSSGNEHSPSLLSTSNFAATSSKKGIGLASVLL